MSHFRNLGIIAIAALALTVMQPRSAQAGSGGFIAGLAVGVATAAIVHHHRRAHAGYHHRPYYSPRANHRHRVVRHQRRCGWGRCGYRHW